MTDSRREVALREAGTTKQWDVVVIGGGASGLGAALEAASRGYRTLLIERQDFAKGTSSRSTKLVHGGVRYLAQFNVTLVIEALRERGYMLRNAPHLVHRVPFIVPVYSYSNLPYYGLGLKLYEWLSGRLSLGKSSVLSKEEVIDRLPTIRRDGLKGGILYYDGQFDDARYAITLLRSIEDAGGFAINYVEAIGLIKRNGRIVGVRARDIESDSELEISARVVVNAGGVFAEEILDMDAAGTASFITLSQGTHFVLPLSWLPGGNALMVPKTDDGRVLFAIPWHQHVIVGTTDEPVAQASVEPHSLLREREFLSSHIQRFLGRSVAAKDVLSVWSGLRPLVRKGKGNTSKLSRDHRILVSPSGLVTVIGGKWTTYRRMGEDTIDRAASVGKLPSAPSRTANLHLHGWIPNEFPGSVEEAERVYGSDLPALQALSKDDATMDNLLHPRLPYKRQEVVWSVRHEMARNVEDVLARRTRALSLDARAAIEAAPTVATLIARELGRDAAWAKSNSDSFQQLASSYLYED